MFSICLRHVYLVRRTAVRMSSTNSSYEDAIQKVNSLQSNKSTIEQIKRNIKTEQKCTNIEDMENYLRRIGIPLPKLDELSVIHVAGTKGKGSTSAMCESILRHHGFRTGFYSSPHLVAVRERIRLNGRPLSEEAFATHLHHVYGLLQDTQEFEGDMPKYFAFLTVLAFHVFLQEKVDVAVVEVGIGGLVDYTNVLRKVPVVGITALGLDHTSILGGTLAEIAAAKAGIMKRGCDAYTVEQPPEALDVLTAVADRVQCTLTVVPRYSSYMGRYGNSNLQNLGLKSIETNASLAIQLSHSWLRITHPIYSNIGIEKLLLMINNDIQDYVRKNELTRGIARKQNGSSCQNGPTECKIFGRIVQQLPQKTVDGVTECKWPGRYQVVHTSFATFYLDGAHTKESMEICANWYRDTRRSREFPTFLIFSATGDRNAEMLLRPLMEVHFQHVYFVTPTAQKVTAKTHDNFSLVEQEELVKRCENHSQIWQNVTNKPNVTVLECVDDAITSIKKYGDKTKPSVLITGSLHLVGAALSIIDPNSCT